MGGICCPCTSGDDEDARLDVVDTFGDYRMLNRRARKNQLGQIAAVCVSVYDGDTATFRVSMDDCATEVRIRFKGIDAPEIRSKSQLEKIAALKAKLRLEQLILNKECSLTDLGNDKYNGRYVATVMQGDTNICAEMLRAKYICKYNGKGAKKPFSERS